MSRIIFVLVLAVNAAFAQRNCDAQGANNPIHDVAVWMERAENAARECDGHSRDVTGMVLAGFYALSGDIDRCQTWLDTIVDESTAVLARVAVVYQANKTGDVSRAMEIAARQKKGPQQDQCYKYIGKGLAEQHRFDEAKEILVRIEDDDVRSDLMELIALELAHAGKWDVAKSLMKQIKSPALWGDCVSDLVVDDTFVKALLPIPVDDDPEMAAAIDQARQRLDHFIDELTNPNTVSIDFSVRVLVDAGDVSQHLWLTPVRFESGCFVGNICREVDRIESLEYGDEISIVKDKASDWSYYNKEKKQYVGFFTSNVENRREQLACTWNTINECELNKIVDPPYVAPKRFAYSSRYLTDSFHSKLSIEDLESPNTRAAEISDPGDRSDFWRAVAWHEIGADNRHAALEALQESVKAASGISSLADQSTALIPVAGAYLQLGDTDSARSIVGRVKASDKDSTLLLKRFTNLFSGPQAVGVFVLAGEAELVYSTLALAKDDDSSSEWNLELNKDRSVVWIAFGTFCAINDQLEYVESHFEDLPTSASKAFVALGVVEGLREVDGE